MPFQMFSKKYLSISIVNAPPIASWQTGTKQKTLMKINQSIFYFCLLLNALIVDAVGVPVEILSGVFQNLACVYHLALNFVPDGLVFRKRGSVFSKGRASSWGRRVAGVFVRRVSLSSREGDVSVRGGSCINRAPLSSSINAVRLASGGATCIVDKSLGPRSQTFTSFVS
jgi:hypothetical protein